MRLTGFFILLSCLQLSAKGLSQNISISVKDAPLNQVFEVIERQTEYKFFYNFELLEETKKVTISAQNLPVKSILDLVFRNQPVIYSIHGKVITVRLKKSNVTVHESTAYAEAIDIKGKVVNENNEPIEGVNVTVKGTNNITSTNAIGEYHLKNVDGNSTLLFTRINMESMEVKINGRTYLDVILQAKITSMQEVVINKGYYTELKKLSTGNVSTVKARDIEKQPVQNPLLALIGRVPGVYIEPASGFPNAGVKVRIQGLNSLSSGVDPLYVIDGVPYTSQAFPTISTAGNVLGNSGSTPLPSGGGNPLSFINPQDIESIDVLKDADATAIYGSRGANGVILITTRKGKAGQTKVNINLRSGWAQVARKLELLNTDQYLEMRNEALMNDGISNVPSSAYDINGIWDKTRYTDWQEELIGGTSNYTDAQFNISGGTSNTQFLLSSGYHKETTVFPGDFSDRKGSLHINMHHLSQNQKFDVQFSSSYVVDNNQIPVTDITNYAINLAPNAPEMFNSDGSLNWAQTTVGSATVSTWTNPLSYLENRYSNKVNSLISNSLISYKVLRNFVIKLNLGYTNFQSNEVSTNSLLSIRPENRPISSRSAVYGNGSTNSWIIEPQVLYEFKIGKGKFESLLGSSFQKNNLSRQQLLGSGYSSDLLLRDIRSASAVSVQSTFENLYKYDAVFGRLNYNWLDKYVLNITARRDGSSRFGAENLFNNFWGTGGVWVFSKENFIANTMRWLSFGKLRVSYGTSGNDQIGDYRFMNLYTPVSNVGVAYQAIPSFAPNGHANPYLQWEETKKLQFGLDLACFNERIQFNITHYRNHSSNLLTSNNLSIVSGFPSVTENFEGVIKNTGWEVSLLSMNIKTRNFTWTSNFNLTIPKNELTSFPNLENTPSANVLVVGKSLYDIRVYHSLGVDPSTGRYLIADKNGDPTNSPTVADKTSFINTSPKYFGGFNTKMIFKGIELDCQFQFSKQNGTPYIFGNTPGTFTGIFNNGNQPVTVLNRWQKSGDVKSIQRFSSVYGTDLILPYVNTVAFSDASISDASFIRLTNLSLSWQIPENWRKAVWLQQARVYIQGQNLFTITKFKGLDPMIPLSTILPPLRVITIGTQLAF